MAGVLVLAQSVFLLASSHPSQAIPSSASRAAGERLVAGMRAFGGDVAVPDNPSLSLLAGMAPAAVPGGVRDVLSATDKDGIDSFRRSTQEAIATHKFSAFIDDAPGAPLYNPAGFLKNYHQCVQPAATLLVPVARAQARPAVVWIPWGGMSCQAAFSILDGGKVAGS